MDIYSFLTEDTRYSIPTVILVSARSEAHVRDLALDRLRENDCHLAVEVCAGEMSLFKVTRAELEKDGVRTTTLPISGPSAALPSSY